MAQTKVQEAIANSVIREALALHEELVDKLRKEAGDKVGFQDVGNRKVPALARKVLEGDPDATIEFRQIEMGQPDETSKLELARQVMNVLREPIRALTKEIVQGDDQSWLAMQRLLAIFPGQVAAIEQEIGLVLDQAKGTA